MDNQTEYVDGDSTFQVPDYRVTEKNREHRRRQADALTQSAFSNDVGKMVGNIYVRKHPLVNAIEGFVGGYQNAGIDSEAQQEAKDLADIRAQLLKRMPSSTAQVAPVAIPDTLTDEERQQVQALTPANRTVPKDPRQYSDEVGRWGIRALQVPGMETLGREAAQEVFQGPRRQAEQLEKETSRKETLRETIAARAAEAETARNWREAEANRSRDDREAARQLSAEDRASREREARADRAANAAAVRADRAAQTPKLPAAAQKHQQAIMNLDSGLAAYNDILNSYDPQSTDAATPAKRAQLGTAFTDMQMRLKEAYELGAITGPDMRILESALSDPTSLTGTLKAAAFGRGPLQAQSGEVANVLNRLRGNFEAQYGVTIPPSARTAPPKQSASGKIAVQVNSAADYAKLQSGDKYIDPQGNRRTKP